MRPDPTLDPAILAKVQGSFDRQAAMRTLGATIAELEHGRCEIALPAAPHITQQQGFAHGGVIATILDSACGYAAFTTMAPESEVVTVEFKINFLKPALGERFIARGQVIRAGRQIVVTQGECVAVSDGREAVVAIMTATMAQVAPR
ncbi:MAG: PaaI family thioesterase [Methylobacteriaceae bacterium]|nr:PaaI family thioesterase [Methylobacteriaceae bacterium]